MQRYKIIFLPKNPVLRKIHRTKFQTSAENLPSTHHNITNKIIKTTVNKFTSVSSGMVEIEETLRRPDYNTIATQFDAIMNHQIALHLPVTASDLIHQLQFHKSLSRPDGHCLLHTWDISTGNHIDNIKQMIVDEFSANFQFY